MTPKSKILIRADAGASTLIKIVLDQQVTSPATPQYAHHRLGDKHAQAVRFSELM